ncbi:hypothetical protein B0T22DRAFT_485995 [Podospora appendiculata]|uniref:Uncharacterized protein n=1 Tax=Podospora appendiculata TaxID=314037 RepID=A0AAE1CEV2_9PEZI|nr:hypothetical protein B0T22DRAFT_485995 [Podospora appendiculata]
MPQVSSIVRGTEPAETTTINPNRDAAAILLTGSEGDSLARLRESPDVFSIFSLTTSFDIPSCDLPVIKGVSDKEGRSAPKSYGLGTGVSCTVFVHETASDEEKEVCAAGTLVALKTYSTAPDELPGGGQANRKLCQLLWQELSVFTHPYLRNHENICKLLYVGWDDSQIMPSLALELAQYGTLEDCLQHLRSYDSPLRKAHLSCDIALGLAAIHACGLVHGDIKPGNIIIRDHDHPTPSRRIVAKLSDFNGVSPAETYGSNRYSFATPDWQAPEATMMQEPGRTGRPGIDWQLCDVYSFAMVVATLWTRTGYITPGGNFLDTFMAYKLDRDQRRAWIQIRKLLPDSAATSIMQLALSALGPSRAVSGNPGPAPPPAGSPLPLHRILTSGLSAAPTSRLPMSATVMRDFSEFAVETGRDLGFTPPDAASARNRLYDEADVFGELFVLRSAFIQRSKTFKQLMFKALLEAVKTLGDSVQGPPAVLELELRDDVQVTEEQLYGLLISQNQLLKRALFGDESLHRFSILAANTAISYLVGVGTAVEEHYAIFWLCLAAGVGEGTSAHLFGPLEQSIDNTTCNEASGSESLDAMVEFLIPRKLWCAYGVLEGYTKTAECLRDMDPRLAEIATRMQRRRAWGRSGPQILHIEPYLSDWVAEIRKDPLLVDAEPPSRQLEGYTAINETALHLCAATGDLESAVYLVRDAGANINATNARNESPIFYATRAGQLNIAKYLYDQGADVSAITSEGYAITHFLSMMDDEHGAELAPLYVSRGAKLDVAASEPVEVFKDNLSGGIGIPLVWAALKGRPMLFSALLGLHKTAQPDSKISHDNVVQLLTALARFHLHDMLEAALPLSSANASALNADTVDPPGPREGLGMTALLRQALDFLPAVLLHRRYLLRTEFRSSKEKTITLLLQRGADPFARVDHHARNPAAQETDQDDGSDGIPLGFAIYTSDTIAFRLFLDHARDHGIDLLPTLEDPKPYGGYSALQRSIYSDARCIFFLLLDHFPSLLDAVGKRGRRPLHSAATLEWPWYVEELLRRGASRYDRSDDRSTPFTWALVHNPNLAVVDLLAEGCDMGPILGHDTESGFTAFGALVEAFVTVSASVSHRTSFSLDRLRYFVSKFGPPSFLSHVSPTNTACKTTVFRSVLLQRTPPSDHAQLEHETSLLDFLLTLYPAEVDHIDFTGRAPLHYAVIYGHSRAVECLLRHGAAVGLETRPTDVSIDPSQRKGYIGYTALDCAVKFQGLGPRDEVLRGGRREIEAWEANMREIIRTLVAKWDSKSGSGVGLHDRLATAKAAGRFNGININIGSHKAQYSDHGSDGDWPQRLPPDGPDCLPSQAHTGRSSNASEEDDATIEVIRETGLSERVPSKLMKTMQDLLGAISPRMMTGNHVRERPPPPEPGYLNTLQADLARCRAEGSSFTTSENVTFDIVVEDDTSSTASGADRMDIATTPLPAGWEAGVAENVRSYYIDHNTRTTTWQHPGQL